MQRYKEIKSEIIMCCSFRLKQDGSGMLALFYSKSLRRVKQLTQAKKQSKQAVSRKNVRWRDASGPYPSPL